MDLAPLIRRIASWVTLRFGLSVYTDRYERGRRFLEECLELNQALGVTREDALRLVDYVYARPIGDPGQELGGVAITLLALCDACNLDFEFELRRELYRIELKTVEHFQKRQAAKAEAGVSSYVQSTDKDVA